MSVNGPKPSQDPNLHSEDPKKPYGTDPLVTPPRPEPAASFPENPSKNSYAAGREEQRKEPQTRQTNESTGEKIKFKSEQAGEKIKSSTEHVGEKLKDTFKNIKDSRQVDELYNYAVTNKEKTTTYILLALGLVILIFFNELAGGLIIGLLAGYYFSAEIVDYIRSLPQVFEGHDQLRYIVLSVLLIGLLLTSPGIIIGAAVVAAFKQIINRKI